MDDETQLRLQQVESQLLTKNRHNNTQLYCTHFIIFYFQQIASTLNEFTAILKCFTKFATSLVFLS